MKMILTIPPADPPVQLQEVREALQILHTEDDARLQQLIYAATAYLDGMDGVLGRALMPQTWKLIVDRFTAAIDLPLPPFRSLTSVTYNDELDVSTVLDAAEYRVVGVNPASVYFSAVRPAVSSTFAGNVEIVYECGYTDLPQSLRYAIMALIRHWYDNPGIVHVGMIALQTLPLTVDALLMPYKVQRL